MAKKKKHAHERRKREEKTRSQSYKLEPKALTLLVEEVLTRNGSTLFFMLIGLGTVKYSEKGGILPELLNMSVS